MKEQEEEEELSQKNLIRTPFLDKGLPYSSAARLELLTLLFFSRGFISARPLCTIPQLKEAKFLACAQECHQVS